MSTRNPVTPVPAMIALPSVSKLATTSPSAMTTIAALLAAANAYIAACTMPFGVVLAWLVPGLFLVSVRTWRPMQAFLFGCLFGLAVGLGQNVAAGSTVDVLLGSLLSPSRGTALLSSALPFGLMAFAYAGLGQNMPSSARGSFASWLWPGAEMLRGLLTPGIDWVDLGGTQHMAGLVTTLGDQAPRIVSFAMVLVSCTAVELLLDRSSWRLKSRSVLRWVVLPVLAIVALYLNLATATPTAAVARLSAEHPLLQSQATMSQRSERRVVDRPVLTSGVILTAI